MNQRRSVYFFVVVMAILMAGCTRNLDNNVMPLEEWQFSYHGMWHPATVPGCIHTDLMNEGYIADPFIDTNEASCAWVSDSVWTYRTTFHLTWRQLLRPKHHDLVFAGLDTRAEIILNGRVIGRADNMFRAWRFPIQDYLKHGDNTLVVRFYPEAAHDNACAASLPYQVPDKRVFTRTAPYQQGWDWGPKLNTCGIWQPVWIEGWQETRSAGTLAGSGLKGFFGAFGDEKPGDAKTADAYAKCRLVRDSGAFCFVINGRPVYMKGANWIPVHSFPVLDEAQKTRYRQLLCSAKEANFNMLRVWGGGIYEPDFFYDLCDSLGIYVWQDFDFSCAFYPGDEAFLKNVRIEAEEQVRRLSKHPCIVMWCGNNEVSNGWQDWGWQQQYGYTPTQIATIESDMNKLFGERGILAGIVHKYMPGVPYLPSSPVWGWGHDQSLTDGDSHYWGVWWGELPFGMYRLRTGRFMSEYGFQSYPELSTIYKFFPAATRLPDSLTAADILTMPTMLSHQKHPRGVAIIDQALQRYYGVTAMNVNLPRYVYLSQLCQAFGTGMGIEAHRVRKGHCWGTLYWQLNDCWPVASWSSIDYYGNWKALHYAAKRLFAPLAVLSEPGVDGHSADIYVVCDTVRPGQSMHGKLLLTLRDFRGKILRQTEHDVVIPSDAASAVVHYPLPAGAVAAKVVLQAQYYNEKEHKVAEKLHYFAAPKQLMLDSVTPVVDLSRWHPATGHLTFTVKSNSLAYGVMLSTVPHVAGHFSDNFFDLLPEQSDENLPCNSRSITFIPANSADPLLQRPIRIVATCYNIR